LQAPELSSLDGPCLPALAAAPALRTEREHAHQYNWDRLRVLASLDIVGSHLGGQHLFWGVGTPLFLILAIALGVQRPIAPDARAFMTKRVRRLLIPWLVWSVAIAAALSITELFHARAPFGWWKGEMLLYGPQIHLWFLPVAACAGVGAHVLHRITARLDPVPVACACLALGVGTLALCPLLGHGWPFEQWSFSAPALLLGLGLGRLMSPAARAGGARLWLAGLLGAAFAAVALARLVPSLAPFGLRYAGALLLLALAAALPNLRDRATPRVAALMVGVYVLHPIVFQIAVEPALWSAGLGHATWARVGFGYGVTLGLVALLRRTPVRALL
jgi:Acyltransferase family